MPAFILNTDNAPAFDTLDTFTKAYIECLFFTETGYGENGALEKATVADLSEHGLRTIAADCAKFQADNAADLADMAGDLSDAGHDFWYSRNGHGTGFWDRGPDRYTEAQRDRLDASARSFVNVCESIGVEEYFKPFDEAHFTPEEAWGYAATWGSFMNSGDPGACFYGFDARFHVQSEQHRADCLAYLDECRDIVKANPENYEDDELSSLDKLEAALRNAPCEAPDAPPPVPMVAQPVQQAQAQDMRATVAPEPFRGLFRVTWERVTPESAEQGDAEARGYAHPNGGTDEGDKVEDVAAYHWTLASVVRRFGRKGCENSGRWFDSLDADENHQTGAETRYSVHPPENCTAASYERLRRILDYRASN